MGIKSGYVGARKPEPFFVYEVEVINAEEKSGTAPWKGAYVDDIALQLEVKNANSKYTDILRVGGQADFNKDGVLSGWGRTGWRVDRLLNELGISLGRNGVPGTNDENPYLPVEVVTACVGKKILVLKYINGWNHDKNKPYYALFAQVELVGENAEDKLKFKFKRQVDLGYPSNYSPQQLENWVGPEGASSEKTVQKPAPDSWGGDLASIGTADDDDLPF